MCMFELGGGSLSPEECQRIKAALESEAARLRAVSAETDLLSVELTGGK